MRLRRRAALTAAAVVATALTAFLAAAPAGADDPDTVHFPDLRTVTPFSLSVQEQAGGQELLRLSNVVWNAGDGAMELRPEHDTSSQTTQAYQRLYSHDASGAPYFVREELVGAFEFHPAHGHWHFEDFARYELRDVAPDGSLGGTVALSDKVSFCLLDNFGVDLTLEHSPSPTYTQCGQDVVQGISVGWGDWYAWNLPGQSIDITGVPDGPYWLVSTADPTDRLAETNDANNWAAVKVGISGTDLTVLSTDTDGDAIPDEIDNCPAQPNADQSAPPWALPADDPDCDGFTTETENAVGTDPSDGCSDDDGDDAWPPDFNASRSVSIVDALFFSDRVGTSVGDPGYSPRYDFNASGTTNIVDVLFLGPYIGESCIDP